MGKQEDRIRSRSARERANGWPNRSGKTAAPLKSLLSLFPDFRLWESLTTIFFNFHEIVRLPLAFLSQGNFLNSSFPGPLRQNATTPEDLLAKFARIRHSLDSV